MRKRKKKYQNQIQKREEIESLSIQNKDHLKNFVADNTRSGFTLQGIDSTRLFVSGSLFQ